MEETVSILKTSMSEMARRQNRQTMRQQTRATDVPVWMEAIQQTCDMDNTLLTYKTVSTGYGYDITYCGVVGGEDEDAIYLGNPTLQSRIPRGYFTVTETETGTVVKTTYGCPKFFGQQDDGNMGLDESGFAPKVLLPGFTTPDLETTEMVYLYEKLNGKFAHMSFFESKKNGMMCVFTSKTTSTMLPVSMLDDAASKGVKYIAQGLLASMIHALVRMWATIPAEGRTAIVSAGVHDNMSFLMEYCDGMHMVPLPYGKKPELVITMVTEVTQGLDVSGSKVCHNIDGMHFTDWLRTECMVPINHVVRYIKVDYQTWKSKTVNEFGTTNYFDNDGMEGYVIHYVRKVVTDGYDDHEVIAIVKGKYNEYIIMRSLREICKRSGLTVEMAASAIRKKLTGPNAYPAGLSASEVDAVEMLACLYVSWLLKYCAMHKTTPRAMLDFSDNCSVDTKDDKPLGMGQSWRRCMEDTSKTSVGRGFRIRDCFDAESRAVMVDILGKHCKPIPKPAATSASATARLDTVQLKTIIDARVIPFLQNAGKNKEKRIAGNVSAFGVTWELTEYPSSVENAKTFIIMQANTGSGKTSTVNTTVECLREKHGDQIASVASADHYFEGRAFNPAEIQDAHHACHMQAFKDAHESTCCKYIFVDNTNCNLVDSWRYVNFAKKSVCNVIFWRIIVHGGKAACKILAERGLHLKDIKRVEAYHDKMYSCDIPLTWDAYFKMFEKTNVANTNGTSIDVQVPARLKELVPGSKNDGHVTLAYRNSSTRLYHPDWMQMPVTYLRIYERVDPNGIDAIACVSVKLPDGYMEGVRFGMPTQPPRDTLR